MHISPQKLAVLLLSIALLGSSAFAARTVDEYKKSISDARRDISWLIEIAENSDADEVSADDEIQLFDRLPKLLPASEQITDGNETVETSNAWFVDSAERARSEKDPAKRREILTEIDERLAAISARIDFLLGSSRSTGSKDEDKQKLSEILKRADYKRPEPKKKDDSESALEMLLRKVIEWIGSWFPSMAPSSGTSLGVGAAGSVLYYLVIALIVALVGFLLYKLIPLFVPSFKRKIKEEKKDRVILGEKIDENVSSHDLFAAADELARNGDLRGAIRKGYVALLCELSDRNLIGLARHKTNRDYLRDVRPRTEIFQEMNGLTGSFERHWYGEEKAENEDWSEFRRRCGETIKAL